MWKANIKFTFIVVLDLFQNMKIYLYFHYHFLYWNDKIDHCISRPSAAIILTMEHKRVLVFDEKSVGNKDARSHSNNISSNDIGPTVLTENILIQHIVAPCLTRPSVSMILTIANIMGADGLEMQVKFQPQGTAYPTYMYHVGQHIFLVYHKDLIILRGQY